MLIRLDEDFSASDSSDSSVSLLVASAVEAITLFYILIGIDVTPSIVSKLVGLLARIGAAINSSVPHASDYQEMVGDCMRKLFNFLDPDQMLAMLEPLDAGGPLCFLLRAARRIVPDKLETLIAFARTAGSFNKVVDTFESLSVSPPR